MLDICIIVFGIAFLHSTVARNCDECFGGNDDRKTIAASVSS